MRISKDDFVTAFHLYSELCKPVTDFALSAADKDSLRAFIKEKNWRDQFIYKLTEDQLEQYLIEDTLSVEMKVFEMDSLNELFTPMVIDGAPFRFQMRTITIDGDTSVSNYDGNLFGGDRYRDLPKHLIISILPNTPAIEFVVVIFLFSITKPVIFADVIAIRILNSESKDSVISIT